MQEKFQIDYPFRLDFPVSPVREETMSIAGQAGTAALTAVCLPKGESQMNAKRVLHSVPALVMGGVLLWAPSTMLGQGSSNPRVLPPDSHPFGLTYGEWAGRFWQWGFSLPATHNPGFGTADCSAGQSGPVWFLGGGFCGSVGTTSLPCEATIVRSCQVPAGKALLVVNFSGEDSFIEEPLGTTEANLRSNAKSFTDKFSVTAAVDGKPVQPVRICSSGSTCSPVQAPLYTYTFPSPLTPCDNVLAAVGEYLYASPALGLIPNGLSSQGVADGYFVLLPPLPAGQHTIYFASYGPGYSQTNTYNLSVVP
jgi:hypothetical protein